MYRPSRRDESGAAATEVVIITPLLLLILMLVVQFALWEHASHVAKAAALEGVTAARLEGGSAADGKAQAELMLQKLGGKLVQAPQVSALRSGTDATVTVTGYVEEVVPGLRMPVKASSTAPVEAFR
jgi:Flp pilus assembly protein TadG